MNAVCGVSSVGICIRPGWLHFVLVEFWLGPRTGSRSHSLTTCVTQTTTGLSAHARRRGLSNTKRCVSRVATPGTATGLEKQAIRSGGGTVPRPWGLDLTRDFSVASCETTHIVDVPAGEKKKSAGLS